MGEILEGLVALLVLILVIGGAVCACIKMDEIGCIKKATALGYKYDWGYFQGCVLEKPDGSRILLEKLRYNELD